jgi:hypothetical protein
VTQHGKRHSPKERHAPHETHLKQQCKATGRKRDVKESE